MAKKHKHEEHVNHERWVISFADMMTLLFALFVVLYAMGVQDLEKLKDLKQSIQFAFNIEGSGKTRDQGMFNKQSGGGQGLQTMPLRTAQKGAMKRFVAKELAGLEEVVGKSLEVDQTDDSVRITLPVSRLFPADKAYPLREEVAGQLDRVFNGSVEFLSTIHIRIEAPNLPIAKRQDGSLVTSMDLCIERLRTLGRIASNNPGVHMSTVHHEFVQQDEVASIGKRWEDAALVVITFTNEDR